MLYHKDVNMPKRIKGMIPTGVKGLNYSKHAKEEFCDKYGAITPPSTLNFGEVTVIEATVFGDSLDKLVLRQKYDETNDLVLVCIPWENRGIRDKSKWFVKTVWLNKHDDTHQTLDKNRFAKRKFG